MLVQETERIAHFPQMLISVCCVPMGDLTTRTAQFSIIFIPLELLITSCNNFLTIELLSAIIYANTFFLIWYLDGIFKIVCIAVCR